MNILEMLFGSPAERGSTYSKQQQSLIDDIINSVRDMSNQRDITQQPGYQTGLNYLQSMFNDPEFFRRFEAPLQRDFQERTVPELANRFAGMGSGGSLGSTAFRNQLAREGSNLSTNIAALRGQMQQQAVPQLLGYSQQPFQNYMTMLNSALQPVNNQYTPASAGLLGTGLGSLFGGLSAGYGQGFGASMAPSLGNPSLGQGQQSFLSRGY